MACVLQQQLHKASLSRCHKANPLRIHAGLGSPGLSVLRNKATCSAPRSSVGGVCRSRCVLTRQQQSSSTGAPVLHHACPMYARMHNICVLSCYEHLKHVQRQAEEFMWCLCCRAPEYGHSSCSAGPALALAMSCAVHEALHFSVCC
jgi:hypothetical protein